MSKSLLIILIVLQGMKCCLIELDKIKLTSRSSNFLVNLTGAVRPSECLESFNKMEVMGNSSSLFFCQGDCDEMMEIKCPGEGYSVNLTLNIFYKTEFTEDKRKINLGQIKCGRMTHYNIIWIFIIAIGVVFIVVLVILMYKKIKKDRIPTQLTGDQVISAPSPASTNIVYNEWFKWAP